MKTKNPKPFCDLSTALSLLFESASKKSILYKENITILLYNAYFSQSEVSEYDCDWCFLALSFVVLHFGMFLKIHPWVLLVPDILNIFLNQNSVVLL